MFDPYLFGLSIPFFELVEWPGRSFGFTTQIPHGDDGRLRVAQEDNLNNPNPMTILSMKGYKITDFEIFSFAHEIILT